MSVTISISGIESLKPVGRAAGNELIAAINGELEAMEMQVRENLSGGVLNPGPTHRLLDSVELSRMKRDGDEWIGYLQAGGPQAMEGIYNELGGTHAYPIEAKNSRLLHFFWRGEEWFTPRVMRQPLPKRPWFGPVAEKGIESMISEIEGMSSE